MERELQTIGMSRKSRNYSLILNVDLMSISDLTSICEFDFDLVLDGFCNLFNSDDLIRRKAISETFVCTVACVRKWLHTNEC